MPKFNFLFLICACVWYHICTCHVGVQMCGISLYCSASVYFSESFLCRLQSHVFVCLGCASAWLSLQNTHLLNGLYEVILQLNTMFCSNK